MVMQFLSFTFVYSSVSNKRPGHLNFSQGLQSDQDTLLETFYTLILINVLDFQEISDQDTVIKDKTIIRDTRVGI